MKQVFKFRVTVLGFKLLIVGLMAGGFGSSTLAKNRSSQGATTEPALASSVGASRDAKSFESEDYSCQARDSFEGFTLEFDGFSDPRNRSECIAQCAVSFERDRRRAEEAFLNEVAACYEAQRLSLDMLYNAFENRPSDPRWTCTRVLVPSEYFEFCEAWRSIHESLGACLDQANEGYRTQKEQLRVNFSRCLESCRSFPITTVSVPDLQEYQDQLSKIDLSIEAFLRLLQAPSKSCERIVRKK